MKLLADGVRLAQPAGDLCVQLGCGLDAELVNVISRRNRLDGAKAGVLESPCQDHMSVQPTLPQGDGGEAHSDLERDARLFRHDGDRSAIADHRREVAIERDHLR